MEKDLNAVSDFDRAYSELKLGPLTLRNRFIKPALKIFSNA